MSCGEIGNFQKCLETHEISITTLFFVTSPEPVQLTSRRRKEGIVPALEPSHALHQTMELAKSLPKDKIVFLGQMDGDVGLIFSGRV